MENKAYIEIHITGKKGQILLTPETYDISELKSLLEQIDKLIFAQDRKNRPIISYEVKEGSVKHIFKTSLQAIIAFNALIAEIENKKSIDFLEHPTAKAIEMIQDSAFKQNYNFEISTSLGNTAKLFITPSTHYHHSKNEWVDAEFYFYGEVVDMGGKTRANIHIHSPGIGTVTIDTPKEILEKYEANPLYKPLGVRTVGKQNLLTGEVDKTTLKFMDFIEHVPQYDENYLQKLIKKAAKTWSDVKDPDLWLQEIRGGAY
ncbi:MAG: hypothetical protein ACD_79C01317G0001 [uncultured bacterium]|nr:MAG: hypothetical protein ACD_79C01317G0001 [uncultured bacterium]